MKPLIAIVGPTALAKSKLALNLAQGFDGEIVSADSRQVYRYMDIGTAKPSLEERSLVRHHVIDVVDPDDDFSLALFHQLANQALKAISRGGKIPFLVGGSGLYIWSVLEGWSLPQVPPPFPRSHLTPSSGAISKPGLKLKAAMCSMRSSKGWIR